jgi:hypothetical protein
MAPTGAARASVGVRLLPAARCAVLDHDDREHDAAQLGGDLPADTTGPAGGVRGHVVSPPRICSSVQLSRGLPGGAAEQTRISVLFEH